jgi:hypothetical protein
MAGRAGSAGRALPAGMVKSPANEPGLWRHA